MKNMLRNLKFFMEILWRCNKKTESVILNLFQNLDSVFYDKYYRLSSDCQLLCTTVSDNEI